MSGNEEIPPDARTEPSDAKITEPTDSTSVSSTSVEVNEEVKTVAVATSVVSDARASASDVKESSGIPDCLPYHEIIRGIEVISLADHASGSQVGEKEEIKVNSVVSDAKTSAADVKERSNINYQDLFTRPFKHQELMKATYLNCPFVWQKDLNINAYHDHDIDLMSASEELFEDMGFRFRSFIVHLVLCYHNFYKRNIAECIRHLDDLEKMMIYSSKRESRDYLFNLINDALYHVIHSCRIYILQATNQNERAEQILNKIIPYDEMNNENKAGILAIRANVYVEYAYEGVRNAVSYISRAVNLDPENPFWHFMKGMFMGRLRRMEGGLSMPRNEEFDALRTAIDKREDAAFIAFAAEAYLETAKTAKNLYMLKAKNSDKNTEKVIAGKLQELNEVAANYFKESVKLKPKSSHLLFRCGKGLINLPPPFQDIKMGHEFIRKGLEIAPDSGYGNHAMAMYIEKVEKDPARAKEYLNVSLQKKNFPAHVDMIRIEFLESKDSQKLFDDLTQLLEFYTEMPRRRKILAELVCFHLFVADDLVEACFYMRKLIQLNSSSIDVINSHKSMILPVNAPIPLSDLIFNQINVNLKNRRLPDTSREVFKKYIQFLINEDITPNKLPDTVFSKLTQQIELGYKNKQMKPVDERVRKAQKHVHNANEFESDPCAREKPAYLNFYKNDLKEAVSGKTRGDDGMLEMLHRMGENPLPKHRSKDADESQHEEEGRGDGSRGRHRSRERQRSRKHSVESSRSSRRHRRRRSSSSASSSSRSSSEDDRRHSRKHRRRYRSPSSTSSSSSYSSYSSSSSDSSSDSRSRSRRRDYRRRRRRRSSNSYDSKRSCDKSSDAKSRRSKEKKRDRSASSSNTSQSESSGSASRQPNQKKSEQKSDGNAKVTVENVNGKAAAETSESLDHVPKAGGEQSVDCVQTQLDDLAISDRMSSRCSPQKTVSPKVPDVVTGTEVSGETSGSQFSGQGTQSTKKSSKHREDREDSDTTSRTSSASKRTSKCKSRDRSQESVRTNASRRSKKEGRSSRRRTSSSSSSSSDGSSSERSRSRRHKKYEKRRANSSDSTEKAMLERSKRGSTGKTGQKDRGKEDQKKHSTKHIRRRKQDASKSSADSSASQRSYSASSRKVDRRRRSPSKESKHSNGDRRHR